MSEFKIRKLDRDYEIVPSYGPRFAGVWCDKDTGELWVNNDGTQRLVYAPRYQTVAADGTNQSTATAISADGGGLVDVTAADGTKGIKLPAAAAGQVFYIYNNSASTLKVYPATGDDINDGSANASVSVTSKVLAVFTCLDTASWAAVYTAAGTYATLTGAETLTNKTLTTPKLGDGDAGLTLTSADQTDGGATVTFPNIVDAADEVVLKDTAQTLTNKTLTSPIVGGTPSVTGVASFVGGTGGAATAALLLGGGTSATKATTATADKNFIGFWTESTAATGDSRGLYLRHYFAGAGSGEAARIFGTVSNVAAGVGGTVNGMHCSLSLSGASGSISGQGFAARFTFGADAQTRTLNANCAVLNVEGDLATGNTAPAGFAYIRFTTLGAVAIPGLLKLPSTASNGTIFAAHTTQVLTHSIRIYDSAGTAFYLMVTDAATNRS